MIGWLDLLTEGDPHPRRFDSLATLEAYTLKMERLSPEAAKALVYEGQVGPPLARRGYRIRPTQLPTVFTEAATQQTEALSPKDHHV